MSPGGGAVGLAETGRGSLSLSHQHVLSEATAESVFADAGVPPF